ncbi:unnamed protein product [Lactuca virosa]|uniref:Uncharacterized protein n=1 Tax=Lactuca virosa TaxID=75947 RepID=A0AAU9PKR7_9ASTR|nr:unnamed protein product [Lactuca virosa]
MVNGVVNEEVKHIFEMFVLGKTGKVGYPEAERCRLSVGHPETLTTGPDIVAAIRSMSLELFGITVHGGNVHRNHCSRDTVHNPRFCYQDVHGKPQNHNRQSGGRCG